MIGYGVPSLAHQLPGHLHDVRVRVVIHGDDVHGIALVPCQLVQDEARQGGVHFACMVRQRAASQHVPDNTACLWCYGVRQLVQVPPPLLLRTVTTAARVEQKKTRKKKEKFRAGAKVLGTLHREKITMC